jgi:hypothetical protein
MSARFKTISLQVDTLLVSEKSEELVTGKLAVSCGRRMHSAGWIAGVIALFVIYIGMRNTGRFR